MRGRFLAALLTLLALPASAFGQPPASTVEYHHVDVIGSVRAVTDQSGQLVRRHDYFPFGEEYLPQAARDTRRFIAKERDAETALDYFGARYLRGRSGRFSSVDPRLVIQSALLEPQRWNRYAYAGNNPVRFVDPDGEDFWDFVNGVGDAIKSNFASGIGRSLGGNSDFRTGQRVGDLVSLAGSAIETIGGVATISTGAAVCGTGVGCIIAAPAIAGGSVLAAHGAGMGAAAGVSLMSNTGDRQAATPGLSNSDARRQAGDLGFSEVRDAPFNSHGKPVFKKGGVYITPDRSGHKGGVWKMFDRKGNRVGTYNGDLTEQVGK